MDGQWRLTPPPKHPPGNHAMPGSVSSNSQRNSNQGRWRRWTSAKSTAQSQSGGAKHVGSHAASPGSTSTGDSKSKDMEELKAKELSISRQLTA
eukprot:1086806-Karenia_brevis.AAC.1